MADRLAQLTKLLSADPADTFILYGLATEYAKLGQLDHAITHFDRCLAVDPDYLYAYYHKAKLLSEHDRLPEAIAALNTGISRAKAARDAKALSEMSALLDELA